MPNFTSINNVGLNIVSLLSLNLREFLKAVPLLLMQIYDSPESDLKLNDVFEFFGVLTFDSEVPADKDDHDELRDGFCEDISVHFPPSKVLTHRNCKIFVWSPVRRLLAPSFCLDNL